MITVPPAIVYPIFVISAAQVDALIEAIAQVESGNNDWKVGRNGELGRLQFTRTLWSQFSREDFRNARNRQTADQVAAQVIGWLSACFIARGARPVDVPYLVGLAWRAGERATVRGDYGPAQRDEAERILNIYTSLCPTKTNLR